MPKFAMSPTTIIFFEVDLQPSRQMQAPRTHTLLSTIASLRGMEAEGVGEGVKGAGQE